MHKPAEGLVSGHVSTVVEVFSPEDFEVEFLDPEGRTFALTEVKREELLVLKHEPMAA